VSEPTGSYTVYRYVGGGRYLNGCPARDLRPADLIEVAEREGIGVESIMRSGLYVVDEAFEVLPFCGARGWESEGGRAQHAVPVRAGDAPIGGARCRAPVRVWGDRCEEHAGSGPGGLGPGDDDAGASKE